MGIDIFLKWDGSENRPADDKIEFMSDTQGHLGYLREAYQGGPYATQILVREAFESRTCEARIPAAKMRARMTKKSRAAKGCNGGHALAMFMATALKNAVSGNRDEVEALIMKSMSQGVEVPEVVTPAMSVEDAVRTRYAALYPDLPKDAVDEAVQSFYDFVELAERREKELGKPCIVHASY